ncbi:hypothetical protein [Inhella sp.]|uniref:hypothetical protein n=1 Tax=Inhella sp. TaxID=1921806 RepID=UPI0035B3BF88
MHTVLSSLPGLVEISSNIFGLQGLESEQLGSLEFARLPLGAIRRTLGGLDGEALVQTEFRVEPLARYPNTIEFLAWFVRDQSRGGVPIQLRPFALPPQAGELIQLGTSLLWQIDFFCIVPMGDRSSAHLTAIDRIANDLEFALEIYGHLLTKNDV